MLLSKIGIVILLVFFLVSCVQDDVASCSSDFVSSYEKMGDTFVSVYRPFAGDTEKEKLLESTESFLQSHIGVKCNYQGEEIDPSQEVEKFVNTIKASKTVPDFSKFISKVIYGIDNRLDVNESTNTSYIEWSKSTFAQMEPSKISDSGEIISSTLGESFRLCSSERFVEQKNPARCSGFLIGPDTLVTAGHCVQSQSECESTVWVADYTSGVNNISKDKIFKCKELVSQELSSETLLDYAVVKLDRKIEDRKYFRIQSESKVSSDSELVVIGHPSGLPTKIADGGKVRDNSNPYFFSAALDTYGGNSGSAVINSKTGVVEGILVRGETDYEWTSDVDTGERCRVSKVCDEDKCRGEDVTRMSQVEGVPTIISESSIVFELLKSSSAPTITSGWISSFQGIERAGYVVGGVKFLDKCGIHMAKVDNVQDWESFHSGSCDKQENLEEVASNFIQKFYF